MCVCVRKTNITTKIKTTLSLSPHWGRDRSPLRRPCKKWNVCVLVRKTNITTKIKRPPNLVVDSSRPLRPAVSWVDAANRMRWYILIIFTYITVKCPSFVGPKTRHVNLARLFVQIAKTGLQMNLLFTILQTQTKQNKPKQTQTNIAKPAIIKHTHHSWSHPANTHDIRVLLAIRQTCLAG